MRLGAFFFEIMPLAGFFIGFHYYGLFIAAVISVGLAGMVLGLAWWRARYVAPFPLFSLVLSAGFTAAAVLLDAAIFIKIQPTIFNGLFAAVLLGGLVVKRAMMQVFFAKQFFLTDDIWHQLSARWGWFFCVLPLPMSWYGAMPVMQIGLSMKPLLPHQPVFYLCWHNCR